MTSFSTGVDGHAIPELRVSTQAGLLSGRNAIVTGASRGIGAGIALELAKRGAKVMITFTSATSEKQVDDIIARIQAFENGSAGYKARADLRNLDAPERIVAASLKVFDGHIDILVNNAGVDFEKPILETSAEDFADVYNLNVRAPFLMIKAVLPHLRRPGRIINISSVAARAGFPNFSLYCSSKAALEGLTRSVAGELGPEGHTANIVAPGPVQSEMLDRIPAQLVDMQKAWTPVERRIGTVEDVAQIVAWLAEESSRWVTGASLPASGGFQMF